jgi:TolB-like protein/class 3 adenylate cyclase/Tfp pilus assembly protein PilF
MTEESFKRKLTAILSADVEGYSRLMGEDEDATIRTLTAYRELMSTLIQKHRGRVVDSPGDNLLAEFLSVVDAVRCAVEIQEELRVRNAELPENRQMKFRIGVNLGDVVEEGERIYGDGVNITARVEGLAEAGGICISGTVYDSIKNKLSLGYESLGEHTVKNIKEPVRVYRMRIGPEAAAPVVREKKAGPRRWQKAALTAVAVLVVVAGAWAIWNFYFRPPPIETASIEKMAYPLPDKPSIAVLPLDNLSKDSEQDYIADGITENIIAGLSQIPDMFVIARNSVFTYKGKPVKIRQVSEELGVRYVLEGSVQRSSDRLRLTVQLIDAIEGHHLWTERYDREFKDLFALQDEVTLKILDAMQVKLTLGESPILYGTDNFEAWGHFVRGFDLLNHTTKENILRARKHFEQAIKLDPDYAQAWTNLASSHCLEVVIGVSKSPAESIKQALEYMQKASVLGGVQAYIHDEMNRIYMLQGQYDKAIAEGEKAVALEPSSARSHIFLAMVLHYAQRPEEAIIHARNAMRLEPYYQAWFLPSLAGPYEMLGRYEEAIATWKQLLVRALRGEFPPFFVHERLALNYARLDRMEEARAHAAEILKIKPDYTVEFYRKTTPYKDQQYTDSLVALLIKAGLPEHPPLQLPDKPSVAVLAFENMSGDPEQEYFSDGLSEEIITALSKTPKLFVIARNSSFTYKGKPVKVQQIGRELGVQDAKTGNHLWAERYDRELRDIFAIQDEITMKILSAVQVKLTKGETARIYVKGTKDLRAYQKVLEAQELHLRFDPDAIMMAQKICEEVIALDPGYAAAYALLGNIHLMKMSLRVSKNNRESMKRAYELATKALSLDDRQANAYTTLSFLYAFRKQHDKSIELAEKAVALEPGSAIFHGALGRSLAFAGRSSEAIDTLNKALRMDPFPGNWYFISLFDAYLNLDRYEEALAATKKGLDISPNVRPLLQRRAIVNSLLNRDEKASAVAAKVIQLHPRFRIERWAKRAPFKDQATIERYVKAMRKAGLK